MFKFKRFFAALLTLALMFTLVPVQTFAAEPAPEPEASVDVGELTATGSNGFGDLLSQEIIENQTDTASAYAGGYAVTNLVIEDGLATVEYSSLEDALLVVALYSEDGLQMLASGEAQVTAHEELASVPISGDMPEYFLAFAYLLDTYDLSPLCAAYETPMYTRQMQELLASTVNDYDPDRVLNLDDDETTNFAVYADSTILLESGEDVNTVISADDDLATYVIGNVDETIRSLQTGDIFVYPYGDNEILLIKVATIEISADGTTATITADQSLRMEEVFSHLKIEESAGTAETNVHEGTGSEYVTYLGPGEFEDLNGTAQPAALKQTAVTVSGFEDSIVKVMSHNFAIEATLEGVKTELHLSGGANVVVEAELNYYISFERMYMKLDTDVDINLLFSITGELDALTIPLDKFDIDLIPETVSLGCEPEIELSFSGQLTWQGTISYKFGFVCGSDVEKQKLKSGPVVEGSLNVEAKLSFTFDLKPTLNIKTTDLLELAEVQLECPVGIEITAEQNGTCYNGPYTEFSDPESERHGCEDCLRIRVMVSGSLGAKIAFFDNIEWLKDVDWLKIELGYTAEKKYELFSAYYSRTYNEKGIGKCPHTAYRIVVSVHNAMMERQPNTEVWIGQDSKGHTNNTGSLAFFLPAGFYQLRTVIDGTEVSANIPVTGPDSIQISPDSLTSITNYDGVADEDFSTYLGNVTTGEILDNGVVASGSCGSGVTWTLYGSGLLRLEGTGAITFYSQGNQPWMKWHNSGFPITAIEIEEGITHIPVSAFYGMGNVESVEIARSVTAIDTASFAFCGGIKRLVIHDSPAWIGESAFRGLGSLEVLELGDNITSIGLMAFFGAGKMTSLTLPNALQVIANTAFSGWSALEKVTIPENVTSIGKYVFDGDSSLREITFTGNAPSIGEYAFRNVQATAYYPADNETWTAAKRSGYGGSLTWVPYTPEEAPADQDTYVPPTLDAVYPGDYSTSYSDGVFTKTASFTGLVPGQQYVLLALENIEGSDPLNPDNLLYIRQAAAAEDGTLMFCYVQRENTEASYVVACGASNRDLGKARISFPEYRANGEIQVVEPTVVYDGEVLVPGRDYTILGSTCFTDSGLYVCYIRGVRNYTGLAECYFYVEMGDEITSGTSGDTTWTFYTGGTMIISGEGAMEDYPGRDKMPWYEFKDQIKELYIEEGVSRIGAFAFYGCSNLKYAYMPECAQSIGDYAFRNCTSLLEVMLPWGLEYLGEASFYGCTSLRYITIPDSLWTIQPYTFKNCTSLQYVEFYEGNLQKISDAAFYNTGLTEVYLPDCLEILDVYAFKNCANLESITLSASLTQIREAVLYGTAISEIVIPEGVTEIGPYAFKNCVNLTAVELPDTLTAVDEAAFYACSNLEAVELPDAVTEIGSYAFRKCTGLKSVTFPENLTQIGESAFYGCSGLTVLDIPGKVTTIQDYAFKGCTGVTSVNLPDSLVMIGDSAFHTCTGIRTIVFPENLSSLGEYCFSGSWNLWQITFLGNAPTIGTNAFRGLAATASYPSGNTTWTSAVRQNYGGDITWKAS